MNRKFGKVNDSAITYAPDGVRRVDHHHEEWDEPMFDPETGEPVIDPETGEQKTEHKTADWDTERTVLHPTADDYLHAKDGPWLPNMDTPPAEPAAEGKHWEARGWTTDGATNTRVYEQVDNPPAPPKRYETLRLYVALAKMGKWDTLESWLASQTITEGEYAGVNALKAWNEVVVVRNDSPFFAAYYEAVKTVLGIDEETAQTILAAAEEI